MGLKVRKEYSRQAPEKMESDLQVPGLPRGDRKSKQNPTTDPQKDHSNLDGGVEVKQSPNLESSRMSPYINFH